MIKSETKCIFDIKDQNRLDIKGTSVEKETSIILTSDYIYHWGNGLYISYKRREGLRADSITKISYKNDKI